MDQSAMACEVCDIILQVSSAQFDEWAEEILGEVSAVLAADCPHGESLFRAAQFQYRLSNYTNRLLAVKKEDQKTGLRFGLVAEETPDGVLLYDHVSMTTVELVSRPDVPGHQGRGIVPDPQWIDMDMVRGWMGACARMHQHRCEEPVWLKGVGLSNPEWLIDVADNCIVSLSAMHDKIAYATLSYTWGQGSNLKTTKATLEALQQPGALRTEPFASQLPENIRHAIDLVRVLGEKYLWVDALCIIQDDPACLNDNLNKMHLIYAGSAFCIVAATGHGADFGLRGLRDISQPRDIEMRVFDLTGGEKLVAKPIELELNTKYSYHQRGWTFQEWLFSRRRLTFRNHLLEWQCQCANWREDLVPSVQADEKWQLRFRNQTESLTPSPSIWNFTSLATNFNRKEFTLSADAPRAFAGIQAMLHRVHPGGLIHGLSEFFFEVHLAWASLTSDVERRVANESTGSSPSGLPSWSWLGWQGDISFAFDSEFQLTQPWHSHEQKVGFRRPVTNWFAVSDPQATTGREIRSAWYEHRANVELADGPRRLPYCAGWTEEPYDKEAFPFDFSPVGHEHSVVFSHELKPGELFKYPVPVLNWSEDPILSEQAPFLRCTTSRVQWRLTDDVTISSDRRYPRRVRMTHNHADSTCLSLTLMSMDHVKTVLDVSTRPKTMELVAFAQGWSTWLGDSPNSDAQDCYFVLLVETLNGVSYRLGCGEARENWWHQLEEEAIGIVLG